MTRSMISRVKYILLQPRISWKEIDREFTKPSELWGKYILPLAVIGPLCGTIGRVLFGARIPLTSLTNPVPLSTAITWGVAAYVLSLIGLFVTAQIVNLLAPGFGGQKNDVQALKAATYSSTAHWIGGVFTLVPALALVSLIFSLYSVYLLFLGLPIVMKVPEDRSMGYTAVVLIASIVVFLILGAVLSAF